MYGSRVFIFNYCSQEIQFTGKDRLNQMFSPKKRGRGEKQWLNDYCWLKETQKASRNSNNFFNIHPSFDLLAPECIRAYN